MASFDVQRKLTAILCADVVGYSRLMGDDEEATLETLTDYRKVFTSSISKFRGRIVDAKGDALLAEFAAVTLFVNWPDDRVLHREPRNRAQGDPPESGLWRREQPIHRAQPRHKRAPRQGARDGDGLRGRPR